MAQGRSFEECLEPVMAAGKIGKRAALDLLGQVYDRAEVMQQTGAGDPYLEAASQLARETLEEAQANRLDALRNAAVRAEITGRAKAEAQGRVAPGISANLIPGRRTLTLADGLRSILHPMSAATRHDTVQGMRDSLAVQMIATLGNRLRQLGLEKAALTDGYRGELVEAIWRMNGGTPNPAVTVSRNAQLMAEAMIAPMRLVTDRLNALGARIGDAIDFVNHTNWDSRQLRKAAGPGADPEAAYQAWKARDVPRMAEKTFDRLLPREGETMEEARERFIHSIYDATESGVHLRGPSMAGLDDIGDYIPPAYEGTRNLARSVSQQRVVYWKDAQAWADHMREFGGGNSIYHDVVMTLANGARRIALMHYLGTNPEGNFETVARRLIEENRTSDELGRLQRQLQGVRNVLGRLTGELNRPLSEDAGQIINWLQSYEMITHLGGVSVTHLAAAPATFTSEMVHHGVPRMQTILNLITAGARGAAERQDALADAGAYHHGYLLALKKTGSMGQVWDRDGMPGIASWAAAHFMNFVKLPQIMDRLQVGGVKAVAMSRLGRQIDGDLADVEEHQQAALRSYNIDDEEWKLLRSSSEPSIVDGGRWGTPSDAINSDPAQVEALLRQRGMIDQDAAPAVVDRAVKKFQWELGDKLLMYLNDAADHAVVKPGVREQAIVLQGLRPGDPGYAIARAVAQFKMWPMAAAVQVLGRELTARVSPGTKAFNIFSLMALSAIGGYVGMSVKDLAAGRPMRDPRKWQSWVAGLAQGGGLGIYGDFLFGQVNRMSNGVLSTLGGPLAGTGERFLNLVERWRADMATDPSRATQHMWPELVRIAQGLIPFGNLIYLKGALDYLVWFHLFEAMSPGWWERTNRRLQKEQGHTMVGYRPGAPIPYTPFAIGAR